MNADVAAHAQASGAWAALCIAVPLYSRPQELRELLQSIDELRLLPAEVVLCEDNSDERPLLREIASEWEPALRQKGCCLRYIENERNLGYDANVRKLFEVATTDWVMLLGNDDVVLPDAVFRLRAFVSAHPGIRVISRSFFRFSAHPGAIAGLSSQSRSDRVYGKNNADPGMIIRLCGFVGGLLIDRKWALQAATSAYDGTLYYQIYLGALAFTGGGIGYASEPTVGARINGRPLFGAAPSERSVHVPGSYTPRGRAAMWRGILRICADIERATSVPLLSGVRKELAGRQSFHVLEMTAVKGRRETIAMVGELRRIGLMRHPLPWCIFALILMLGRHSRLFFGATRASLQR